MWSLDHTLSLIIVQCLKKFKQLPNAHYVENSDLPKYLQLLDDEDILNLSYKEIKLRWNWILDEIIFAHEEIASGNHYVSLEKDYQDRIHNGLVLFGKYYRRLWI